MKRIGRREKMNFCFIIIQFIVTRFLIIPQECTFEILFSPHETQQQKITEIETDSSSLIYPSFSKVVIRVARSEWVRGLSQLTTHHGENTQREIWTQNLCRIFNFPPARHLLRLPAILCRKSSDKLQNRHSLILHSRKVSGFAAQSKRVDWNNPPLFEPGFSSWPPKSHTC